MNCVCFWFWKFSHKSANSETILETFTRTTFPLCTRDGCLQNVAVANDIVCETLTAAQGIHTYSYRWILRMRFGSRCFLFWYILSEQKKISREHGHPFWKSSQDLEYFLGHQTTEIFWTATDIVQYIHYGTFPTTNDATTSSMPPEVMSETKAINRNTRAHTQPCAFALPLKNKEKLDFEYSKCVADDRLHTLRICFKPS